MSNVALATRSYGEGRVCIFTDRIGGYRTGHGDNLLSFWRSILEWTGERKSNETIHIGIVESYITNFEKRLNQIQNVIFEPINLQYIANYNLNKFDLLYFIGLPEAVSLNVSEKISDYVESGHGVLVETPNRGGEPINVLSSIDSIYCSSAQRPSYSKAYWTTDGLSSYVYSPDIILYFMTTIDSNTLSDDWNTLMSDTQITLEKEKVNETKIVEIETVGSATSEFGLSYITAMQNGLVEINQFETYESSESSSLKNWSSTSSSQEPFRWSFCDNRLAQWKMNENYSSNLVWDYTGNFSNVGYLRDATLTDIPTNNISVIGKINRAFNFDGNKNVSINSNTLFNFTDTMSDVPFSIAFWLNVNNASIYQGIMEKLLVWFISLESNCITLTLNNEGNLKTIVSDPCIYDSLWNFIVIQYDGISFNLYVNTRNIPLSTSTTGSYVTMSNSDSLFVFGKGLVGKMDNLILVDRELLDEVKDEISDIDELLDDELEKELRVDLDEDELNISFFHPLIL